MAYNDIILVDGIIDEILSSKAMKKNTNTIGEAFELFSISELLKSYDLTEEQIKDGIVDGGDDGGIDGVYIFVNGNYLSTVSNYNWPKQNGILEIYIITCKHHSTYEIKPLESIDSSLSELLNFSIAEDALNRKYNTKIISKRRLIIAAYRKLASQNIEPIINLCYISRGDSETIPDNIKRTGDKLVSTCSSLFQHAKVIMTFWGSKEIISQFRIKRNSPIEIKFQRYLQYGSNFVVLVDLKDYYNSIVDNGGRLKRYLFDANVRDYLGENRTNADITKTLESNTAPDFWLLNNGITVLTSNATPFDNVLTIEDMQIVNGLQTTVTIYNYFANRNHDVDNIDDHNKNILIKVIKSNDSVISNQIVKATNNQSTMPLYALHANSKIQRDIEDILLRFGFGYERRPNYYANLGYPESKIIAPLYIAGGYISLILKLPHKASTIKAKFLNNQIAHDRVFSDRVDINLWPIIATILKQTDLIAEQYRTTVKLSTEKYLKTVRYVVSLVSLARLFGKLSFGTTDLIKLDVSLYTETLVRETVENLISFINASNAKDIFNVRKKGYINRYLKKASEQFTFPDYDSISNRPDIYATMNVSSKNNSSSEIDKAFESDESFLELILNELPEQPWAYGFHKDVAAKLQCSNSKVYKAICELIKRGVYEQDQHFQ